MANSGVRVTRTYKNGQEVWFESKYAGIGELLRDKALWAGTEPVAEKIKAIAIATAPVAKRGPHKGRYKKSFEVVNGERASRPQRVFSRVQNTSREAMPVEYGTVYTRKKGPPHRTLRKAARAVKGT